MKLKTNRFDDWKKKQMIVSDTEASSAEAVQRNAPKPIDMGSHASEGTRSVVAAADVIRGPLVAYIRASQLIGELSI